MKEKALRRIRPVENLSGPWKEAGKVVPVAVNLLEPLETLAVHRNLGQDRQPGGVAFPVSRLKTCF